MSSQSRTARALVPASSRTPWRTPGTSSSNGRLQLGGRAPEGADAVIVLGGAMHPDEDERHGWLSSGAALARGLARRGDATARRLPRLAARRPGGRRGGLPLERVRSRLDSGRAHRCRRTGPGGRQRCPSSSTPSSGTTTPTLSRPEPSSWRAAASARRPSGSETPGASSFTRRCGPSRWKRGSARIRRTSWTLKNSLPRCARASQAGTSSAAGLCRAFLAAA